MRLASITPNTLKSNQIKPMQVAPKIVKYTVCQAENLNALAGFVNRAIAEGFQPHGDLHIHTITSQTTYTREMVKMELRPLELPADLQPGGNILVPQPRLAP